MSVSSKFAGKKGKCPKCQEQIDIIAPPTDAVKTAASPQAPRDETTATAKQVRRASPTGGKKTVLSDSTASGDAGRMNSLLDEIGVVKKTGPVCPSCAASIRPGTLVCVGCGFHFEANKKVKGYNAKTERPDFDNEHLQQAVNHMKRETVMESRREKAAMPWWVLASFLIGAVLLCGAGVALVDANFGEMAAPETLWGRIQRIPLLVTLGITAGLTGVSLAFFAHLNICIFGFQKKMIHGVGCFFIPLIFSLPYGIINWSENKAPVKGLILAALFIGAGVALIISGGGFDKLKGVL
jgi:hypothetical protein